MDVVVDVQGYRYDNKFIPKEVAVVSTDCLYLTSLLIKPPVDYETLSKSEKKEIRFLEKHHHGLNWNSGYVSYESFESEITLILQSYSQIYVKGVQKMDFLRFLNRPVYNLEDYGCPAIRKLKKDVTTFRCTHHSLESSVCALENALIISHWKLNNTYNEHNTTSTESRSYDEAFAGDCFSSCICFRHLTV